MKNHILSRENILNYQNYKYCSEDNTFLTRFYNKIWYQIQKLVLLPIGFIFYPIITSMFVIYYLVNFIYNISKELKMDIFKSNIKKLKVYCCGVFDLCHIGHMMLFEKIVKSFDEAVELIVGVHSDKSCSNYKRLPIICENLRYETVAHCKYVDKVYVDAPLITTKEFILDNFIDVVDKLY